MIEEKHYTATQPGKMFGISANRIGRIVNDNNMKTDEYGEYYLDKSPYSSKQVESFRYNEKALKKLNAILMAENGLSQPNWQKYLSPPNSNHDDPEFSH